MFSMAWHNTSVHQGLCFHYGSHYQAIVKDRSFQVEDTVPIGLGRNQAWMHQF